MIFKPTNKITYGRGYAYGIQYHIAWCTKYRNQILTNEIKQDFINEIKSVADEYGFVIETMECLPDSIHLFINCSPQHFVPTLIKVLKGNSARHLFMKHPDLKSKLSDGHLWNPSYFVATVSENVADQLEEYFSKQKVK